MSDLITLLPVLGHAVFATWVISQCRPQRRKTQPIVVPTAKVVRR